MKTIVFTEKLAQNLKDSAGFRKSQDFQEFLEKWNLPTFFELKKNEIIKPLLVPLKCEDLSDFILSVPSSLYSKALNQCLESTIVPELHPKFMRLLFQIISTYSNFITRKLNSQTKLKGISVDDLVIMVKDISSLKFSVCSLAVDQAVKDEIESSLKQLLDPCIRALIENISKLCIQNLESIRTIPSSFRMTGRSMPSLPSAFVSNFFQPLKLICVDNLPREKIVNKVLVAYVEIVQETKQEIIKVNEVIAKYNPDSQDTSKMIKQLELDQVELVKELENLGFTAENNEIVRQIQALYQ